MELKQNPDYEVEIDLDIHLGERVRLELDSQDSPVEAQTEETPQVRFSLPSFWKQLKDRIFKKINLG